MSANEAAKYPEVGTISWAGPMTAANTNMDGTGTTFTVATGGVDGTLIRKLRFKHLGTNVQTVARVFINNGSSSAVAANNVLVDEVYLSATTASNNTPNPPMDHNIGTFVLPAGYKILVCLGTAVSAGWMVTAFGADY